MNRREFLKTAGKYAAIAGLCAGAPTAVFYLAISSPTLNNFKLPNTFQNQGFVLGEYTDKKTDKDVIILAEDHEADNIRTLNAGLIDYAQKEWGVQALGLEGLYGNPSPNIEDVVEREFSEYLGNLDKDVSTRETYAESAFAKYVRQESLPCFGIEQKDQYLRGLILRSFEYGIAMIHTTLFRDRVRYNKIPHIERIERFFADAKKQFNVPIPDGTMLELAGRNPVAPEVHAFMDYTRRETIDARNKTFAENTAKYLEQNPAKRILILVGAHHVRHPQNRANTQDILPYSSRVIYAPGALQ